MILESVARRSRALQTCVLFVVLAPACDRDADLPAVVSTPIAPAPAAVAAIAPPFAPGPASGEGLYGKYCALCHGAHLEGYVADNAPALASPTFRATATEAFLRTAIERGRPGTAMAAYGRAQAGPLGPAEVELLVGFLRAGAPPLEPPRNLPANGDGARGKAVYDAQCAQCHGTAERRLTAVHLMNAVLLASASDDFLRVAIERGRPGTPMVAWQGTLAPQQIEDVLTYIRSQGLAMPAPPPPPAPPGQTRLPLTGPVVLNPRGKAPDFSLREDLYVPVAQVGKAFADKRRLVILDARPPSEYLGLHIAGAVSLPYYDFTDMAQVPNDGTWVIAYCACPHHVSGTVVEELRKRGYKHTAILDEGIYVWQQQGFAVVSAPGQPLPPMPPPMPGAPPPVPPGFGGALPPARPPL